MERRDVLAKDFDDVVVLTFKPLVSHFQRFAITNGHLPPTEREIRAHWGKARALMLQALFPDAKRWPELYTPEALPGVRETTLALKNRGYHLVVVSSCPRAGIEKAIEQKVGLPLDTYHQIFGDGDCQYLKPDPRVFDPVIESLGRIGKGEENLVYCGDFIKDFWAARGRGIPFVGVLTGLSTREEFLDEGLQADQIVPTFNEVPGVLELINSRIPTQFYLR